MIRRYRVRLADDASADLAQIYRYVRAKSASSAVARGYIGRIRAFLAGFETFPERGSTHDDIREGLRLVGFERSINVAFVVETDEVVVLRVLYGGQQFESNQVQWAPSADG